MTSPAVRSACAAIAAMLLFGMVSAATLAASQPATPAATPTPAETTTTLPPGTARPVRCRMGMHTIGLHDFNVNANTFDADFWIWSVCPKNTFAPLNTLDFVNANKTSVSLYSHTIVGDVAWDQAEVRGTFRHHWSLKNFPFDKQVLQIAIEDSVNTTASFVYVADEAGSTYEPGLQPDGWRVVNYQFDAGIHPYQTTYGDPRQPVGMSDFSRLTMSMTLTRSEKSSFFKLTFVVYIAFLISLISYFLNMHNSALLTARLSVISGALFAVAVNLRTATSALGSEAGLTMVDKIHIAALVALLIDAIAALISQLLVEGGHPADEIIRFNRIVMAIAVTGFIVANIVLIGRAAYIG